ncbi:hypothetical protein GCAAIG_00275 [Candidatus Electronema halotolerans]
MRRIVTYCLPFCQYPKKNEKRKRPDEKIRPFRFMTLDEKKTSVTGFLLTAS